MIVLKIAGLIAAGLAVFILIVLAGMILLLSPRVAVDLHAQNGALSLRLGYGWLHKTIRLPKHGKKPDGAEKPDKPEKTEEQPAGKRGKDWLSGLDLGDVLCELLDFLEDVKDRLRIDVLCAHVTLATGDAAKTGLYLGYLSAVSGMLYPFLARNFTIRSLAIDLDGDFEGSKTRYDLRLACSFRPIRMMAAGIRHGLKLYRMMQQTQSMEAKAK